MSEIPQIVLDAEEKTLSETGDSFWQIKKPTGRCVYEVHSKWGTGKPVELKLRGKAMQLLDPIPSAK